MDRYLRESVLGVVVSFVLFPAAASATMGVLYAAGTRWDGVLNRDAAHTALWSTLIALGFTILLGAVACRRFTRADGASPRTHGELRVRVDELASRVEALSGSDAETAQAREHLRRLEEELKPHRPALRWLLMTGYVDLWRRVHRIEEALLAVEPEPTVLREALKDRLRLQSSAIPQSATLAGIVESALASLGPAGARLAGVEPAQPPEPAGARAALAEVRNAVNDYRDDRRAGLVHARNNLLATVVFTGLTAYTLLIVAMLLGASREAIGAAAVFYLVGGIVGLFKQLRAASAADTVLQDDFGLAAARLIHTPLFSGLAALGGVVLVNMLERNEGLALAKIFDLGDNQIGLVTAAIFGLTPALLITGLQKQVEQYKSDLRSSEAAEAKPAPEAAPPPSS